ncbi:MAG: hypothetical protein IJW12_06300 [Opitutales bacterium]|nr:hypothetical protein [Opitutales bacterium]
MTYPELLKKVVLSCIVFSCVPALLPAAETEPAMKISISSTLPAMEGAERTVLFNARSSDGEQDTIFTVVVEKKPIPRKEFILVEPPTVVWKSNGVWHESEVLDENGNVDPFKRRISLKQKSDWGKEDKLSATVHYYEVREHPLPTNPDGSPADNGPYWLASDTDSLIAVAPEVEIESITFNHIPGNSDNDGIDLRTEYFGDDIVGPEWTLAGTQAVAYRAGVRPTVKVNFKLLPERLTRVKVGATEEGTSLTWGIAEAWGNRLGGEFSGVAAVSPMVDKGNVTWTWSATGFNGVPVSGWNNFRKTEFPVYKILDKPRLPWKEGEEKQKPWVVALDFAIEECGTQRIKSKEMAIGQITKYLWESPKWQYSQEPGSDVAASIHTFFLDKEETLARIYFDDFMAATDEGYLNCVDSAAGLCASASILGLDTHMIYQKPWNTDTGALRWNEHCFSVFSGKAFDACKGFSEGYVCFVDVAKYGNPTSAKTRKVIYLVNLGN